MEKTDENQNKIQEYSTLTLTNNFMFCKVMSDKSLCKEFLEIMLKIKIDRIEYVNYEQEMNVAVGTKSVRFDVYVEDGKRIFDIEMQMVNSVELAKRARYYQSIMDIAQMNKGMFYMQLKESFVIFLMPEDSFKGELSCYTFENMCRENPSIKLDDKTTKIFYNFNEYSKEKDDDIRKILNYFATGEKTGGITDRMQELLDTARNNSQWRADYIIYEQNRMYTEYVSTKRGLERGMAEGLKEGLQKGMEEGLQKGAQNARKETAKNMLSENIPIDTIVKCTGLSLDEVKKLEAEFAE